MSMEPDDTGPLCLASVTHRRLQLRPRCGTCRYFLPANGQTVLHAMKALALPSHWVLDVGAGSDLSATANRADVCVRTPTYSFLCGHRHPLFHPRGTRRAHSPLPRASLRSIPPAGHSVPPTRAVKRGGWTRRAKVHTRLLLGTPGMDGLATW